MVARQRKKQEMGALLVTQTERDNSKYSLIHHSTKSRPVFQTTKQDVMGYTRRSSFLLVGDDGISSSLAVN